MSIPAPQIRAYIRPSRRHGLREQRAIMDAAGIDPALTYVEGKTETLLDCLRSLMPGDTLAVTTLARLHNRRDGLLAAVRELSEKQVTLWIVTKDRKYRPGDVDMALEDSIEALSELADDKRLMTSADARRAALERWKKAPKAKAEVVWKDKANYPTRDEALGHEDMRGWSYEDALAEFGPRYPAVRRKT